MALAVIFAHAYPLSTADSEEWLSRFSAGQAGFGGLAVYIFFSISGFLITRSWIRKPVVSDYLERRARRIYPGFLVAIAISAFVVTPLAMTSNQHYLSLHLLAKFARAALLFDRWNVDGAFVNNPYPFAVNGSIWTIRYEFACYLLVLGVGVAVGRRRFARAIVVIAVVFYMTHVAAALRGLAVRDFSIPVLGSFPTRLFLGWMSCFACGAVAAAYPAGVNGRRYRPTVALAGLALLLGSCRLPRDGIFEALAPVVLTYSSLSFAYMKLPLTGSFATRVGGDYSYGIYLYAFPIQQLLTMAFGSGMAPVLNFAIASVISIFAGVLSWHLVEKRFIARVRRAEPAMSAPLVPPAALACPVVSI